MQNLPDYNDWLITEKNKAVEFFRNNPEYLSDYSTGVDSGKDEWNPQIDTRGGYKLKEKIQKQALSKAEKLKDSDTIFTLKGTSSKANWTYAKILAGYNKNWSWYGYDDLAKQIIKHKTFKTFKEEISKKYGASFRLPGQDFGDIITEIDGGIEFIDWLEKNWNKVTAILKWTTTALDGATNLGQKQYNKMLLKVGLSQRDVEIAMSHISTWTSMSRKRLKPEVFPLLQKLSVDSSKLPKYVYRGIFYDGAKIKDLVKWSKKWYPGAKPGVSQGKATSFSIDRGTAASFMTDQDFIKDRKGGYYMLLKWKVNPDQVVADLRNLPVDHSFWNQQEIIVSPKAKDYEVDVMIPGEEGDDALREFTNSIKGGAGAWGTTKADSAMDFLNSPFDTLSINDRMQFKIVSKITVAEFKKKYPGSRITAAEAFQNMQMPLFNVFSKYVSNTRILSSTRNEVKFVIELGLNNMDYIKDPLIKAAYKDVKTKTDFNQFAGNKVIKSNVGTVKLIDDDYYDMDIEITLPTKYKVEYTEYDSSRMNSTKPGDEGDRDKVSNAAIEEIFNQAGGSSVFASYFKNKQTESTQKTSKNISIAIK